MSAFPITLPKKLSPLYFLVGEDDFQKREFIARLKKRIAGAETAEYLSAASVRPADILEAVLTPSLELFAPPGEDGFNKLVVVDQAEQFKAAEWKIMAGYLARPEPPACLVFLIKKKPNKFTPPPGVSPGAIIRIYPLKEAQLSSWLKERCRILHLRLSDPARRELLFNVGSDLHLLNGTLEKLSLFKGEEGEVSVSELRRMNSGTGPANIFKLTGLLLDHSPAEALALVRRLWRASEHPFRIFNFLIPEIRKLWLAREVWEKTRDPDQTCRAAGVRYYRNDFLARVRKLDPKSIPYFYRCLFQASLALRGAERSPELVLERLVIDLSRKPDKLFSQENVPDGQMGLREGV